MDPISQMALGSAASLCLKSEKTKPRLGMMAFVGAMGGLFPDIDVFITSKNDPLMMIEFHRHFTHALLFTPVIATIVASILYLFLRRRQLRFGQIWLWAWAGALTHGVLDACTSYGTHLWYPFSNHRSAWNIISIIDPIFTGILLIGIVWTILRRQQKVMVISLILAIGYLGLGAFQRMNVIHYYRQQMGTQAQDWFIDAKPSFANLWLWRVIATTEDHRRVDAVHYLPFIGGKIYIGHEVPFFSRAKQLSFVPEDSRAARDIERFNFFSDNYLYLIEQSEERTRIGDLRYSLVPNSIEPLWVIEINHHDLEAPTPYLTTRQVTQEKKGIFGKMLWRESL